MPALQLSIAERKVHRAEAHHLDPVVMIGNDGLTPAVVKETDAALSAHGLVKVRVLGDDRATRDAMYTQLADQLSVDVPLAKLALERLGTGLGLPAGERSAS